MANGEGAKRLAVLIDADNASAKIVDGLFEEIAKLGEASVRRIYGDFSSPQTKPWADVLTRYAILPHQQFAHVKGKNASDIALVIDAMDLLHAGRLDGFCLVSSDSDFTRLASRMREEGVDVYGFGEQKTPVSFRQACHRFIYTENLAIEPIAYLELVAAPGAAFVEPSKIGDAAPGRQFEYIGKAKALITRAIVEIAGEDGWAHLGTLGNHLQKLASDFDARNFGYSKLSDLVRKIHGIEVRDSEGGRVHARLSVASHSPDSAGKARKLLNQPTAAPDKTPA